MEDANLGLGPRLVYRPEAAQIVPTRRRCWLQAVGMASWPLVLIPALVAVLLGDGAMADISWWLLMSARGLWRTSAE